MSRSTPLIAIAALFTSLWVVHATATAPLPSTVTAGHSLGTGGHLRSANGAYVLTVGTTGDLAVTSYGRMIWRTYTSGLKAHLDVRSDGDLQLVAPGRVLWRTSTRGSGTSNRLTLLNDGNLALTSPKGGVWSSRLGNGCTTTPAARQVNIVISTQLARFCSAGQQILMSRVTTGASSLGNGTPTGTWRVQAKVRDTVLRPAAGGSYPVHFWMPYDGAYGMHDSPWQNFPYGSGQYRTSGSHGCVHVQAIVMDWFFRWAPVGTTVSIRA